MTYQGRLLEVQNERKEKIVKAAAELFLELGIEQVTMTQIASKSGVGVASLYRYFGKKESLVIEAGALLWKESQSWYQYQFQSREYKEAKGIQQLTILMESFRGLYQDHQDFLRFVHEFDLYVRKEEVLVSELTQYETSISSYYEIFLKACQKGEEDGTVKPNQNWELVYHTVAHALLAMEEKFLLGEIIGTDSRVAPEVQLKFLTDLFLSYIGMIVSNDL